MKRKDGYRSGSGWLAGVILLLVVTRVPLALVLPPAADGTLLYEHYAGLVSAGQLPYEDFAFEYPPWTLPLILIPAILSDGISDYTLLFRLEMVLVELGVVFLVHRLAKSLLAESPLASRAAPMVYFFLSSLNAFYLLDRLDLPVAFLVLLTLCLALRRGSDLPVYAAAALATSIKLGPLLLLPFVILHRWRLSPSVSTPVRGLLLFAAFLMLLNLPFVLVAGGETVRFLEYHSLRGVHIESTYGSLLLVLRYLGLPVGVEHSFGSFNLVTAWTAPIKVFAGLATAVLQVALVVLAAAGFRRTGAGRARPDETLVLACAASFVLFFVTGPVLSPQFLLWVHPLLAVLLARHGERTGLWVLWIGTALLTPVVYPVLYASLIQLRPAGALALLMRNALLIATAAVLGKLLWAQARARRPAPPDRSRLIPWIR